MRSLHLDQFSAVIFDLDGLLIDTEPCIRKELHAQALRQGIEIPGEIYPAILGRSWVEAHSLLKAVLPWADVDGIMDAANQASLEYYRQRGGAPLKPGAAELLDLLERRGIPSAVASSSDPEWVDACLGDLRSRFRCIVSADGNMPTKPAPDLFLRAARELGAAPAKCLVLEDSKPGLEAAQAAGISAIWVPDTVRDLGPLPHGVVRVESLVEVRALLLGERRLVGGLMP